MPKNLHEFLRKLTAGGDQLYAVITVEGGDFEAAKLDMFDTEEKALAEANAWAGDDDEGGDVITFVAKLTHRSKES